MFLDPAAACFCVEKDHLKSAQETGPLLRRGIISRCVWAILGALLESVLCAALLVAQISAPPTASGRGVYTAEVPCKPQLEHPSLVKYSSRTYAPVTCEVGDWQRWCVVPEKRSFIFAARVSHSMMRVSVRAAKGVVWTREFVGASLRGSCNNRVTGVWMRKGGNTRGCCRFVDAYVSV